MKLHGHLNPRELFINKRDLQIPDPDYLLRSVFVGRDWLVAFDSVPVHSDWRSAPVEKPKEQDSSDVQAVPLQAVFAADWDADPE